MKAKTKKTKTPKNQPAENQPAAANPTRRAPAPPRTTPSVLSFRSGTIISDAVMSNIMEDGKLTPVHIVRHGIRGTQNTPNGTGVGNIQITESAKLSQKSTGLDVSFTMYCIHLNNLLSDCHGSDNIEDDLRYKNQILEFLRECSSGKNSILHQCCQRYARNILNGRWLWRNRITSNKTIISVKNNELDIKVDAEKIPLDFIEKKHNHTKEENALADVLVKQFTSNSASPLEISAKLKIPANTEVYPSQDYLEDKPKGYARSLYKLPFSGSKNENETIVGEAGLRDQKLGNAIRTIDTSYKKDATTPIAIEPVGSNIETNARLRAAKDKNAFYLIEDLANGMFDTKSEQAPFLLACFIRGGVYAKEAERIAVAATDQ